MRGSNDIESDDNDDAIIGTDVMPPLFLSDAAVFIFIHIIIFLLLVKVRKKRKRDEIIGHVDNMMITFFLLVVLANSWILT